MIEDPSGSTGPPFPSNSPGRWLEAALTSAGIGSMAGMFAGLVWGGVGGRVAMRVLFLTSGGRVRGLTSDDGFEIGTISGATVFLLIFTAIVGAIAGFIYGLLRMVTGGPTWLVALGVAVAVAVGGGASIVHVDGVDFRLLEPLWLTVALFVLLPGLWGLTVVLAAQRLMRPGMIFTTLPVRINEHRWPALGWLVLAAITVAGLVDLASDIEHLKCFGSRSFAAHSSK